MEPFVKLIKKSKNLYNNDDFNLVSQGNNKFYQGSYKIENIDEFIELYTKVCFDLNIECCFLERPINNNNKSVLNNIDDANLIKIDIDLKYNKRDNIEHLYKEEYISELVNLYFKELSKYINLNEVCSFGKSKIINNLKFYVLERSEGYIDLQTNKVKDGLHIIVPNFLINNVILHKVRLNLLNNDEFKKLHQKFNQLNNIEDFIDKSVISTNPWFLYGSTKPYKKPYLLTKIYKYNKKDKLYTTVSEEKLKIIQKDNLKLVKQLTNFDVKQLINPITGDVLKQLEHEINIGNNNSDKNFDSIHNALNNNINITFVEPDSKVYSEKDFRNYIDCIKDERASDYNIWWKLGQSLYNINAKRGKVAWIYFSKKCIAKFDEDVIEIKWKEFRKNYINYKYQYSISFIKKLAYEDNKEKFNNIDDEKLNKMLKSILSKFDNNIYKKKDSITIGDSTFSKQIKKLIDYLGNVHFVHIKDNFWYFYEKHIWKEDNEGLEIQNYIRNKVLDLFTRYYSVLQNESVQLLDTINRPNESDSDSDCDVNEERNFNKRLQQTCLAVISYLEALSSRNKLYKDLCMEFHDREFFDTLDKNPYLFHFSNGVFDIIKLQFRDGCPDDRISISSNTKYITDEERYSMDEYRNEENDFNELFDKIFAEEELRIYIFDVLGLCMIGRNYQQKFRILTGEGSNGKSALEEMVDCAFGDYYKQVDTSLFSQKQKNSASATPHLVPIMKARIIVGNEIPPGSSLNTAMIKVLTGGDKISYRANYGDQQESKLQGTVFLICNDTPSIDNTDHGSWRRMVLLPFMSTFCDRGDEKLKDNKKYPYHFEKNAKFNESKYKKLAPMFMNELIKHLSNLKPFDENGQENNITIYEPQIIKDTLAEYKRSKCIYQSFRHERIHQEIGKRLSVQDVFAAFRFYADECNVRCKPTKQNFTKEISRLIGSPKGSDNKYWIDLGIKEKVKDPELGMDTSDFD